MCQLILVAPHKMWKPLSSLQVKVTQNNEVTFVHAHSHCCAVDPTLQCNSSFEDTIISIDCTSNFNPSEGTCQCRVDGTPFGDPCNGHLEPLLLPIVSILTHNIVMYR